MLGERITLLTRQRPEDQERINLAIVDSINRNLQSQGFVEDSKSPDFPSPM